MKWCDLMCGAERSKTGAKLLLSALLLFSLSTAAQSAWIGTKATVAQHLLNRAWQRTLQEGAPVKPWPWADTAPVARLSLVDSGKSMIVLDGAHGQAMAFGPARLNYASDSRAAATNATTSSAMHDKFGAVVAIAGHRDTHMAFLQHADTGTRFELENIRGEKQRYRMTKKQVVNSVVDTLSIDTAQAGLVLITCFPFNATQTGGPLRMIASAVVDETPPLSAEQPDTLPVDADASEQVLLGVAVP